ncbi:imidazole glycerol phosphate synthase subunit HisH [Gammaproteobacteria bacterium]|nr:imidazole glycerol phosphate synthase subunit HisH [Gammaproteobacteria bacterium]
MSIAIIDCGGANLRSVQHAFQLKGYEANITTEKTQIGQASHVVIPGVGSAGMVMNALDSLKLINLIKELRQPVLGICIGMQILYEYSQEQNTKCLGIINGEIKKLPIQQGIKIPQMGWNEVIFDQSTLSNLSNHYYFANSYYAERSLDSAATTDYKVTMSSVVIKNNFIGCQFHPEKSSVAGEQFLDYFLGLK